MRINTTYLKRGAAGVAAVAVLYLCCVGAVSNVTSAGYQVETLPAEASERDRARVIAQGVTYAINEELGSLFGWLPNDLCLVPSIIDNKTGYQRGVIYATRPASDIVAKNIARYGTRDTMDSRLADATSRYFTYGENVWGFWFIYDCENKYKAGVKNWLAWAESVGTDGKNAGVYNMKSDDVYAVIKYCAAMTDYALGILNNTDMGHFQTDDNVYFAKGVCAVTGNLLRAMVAADASIVERGGAENVNEALKRFEYISAFNPVYVFAGGNAVGDAMMPNHVAALARHIDVANNRLNDIMASMEK